MSPDHRDDVEFTSGEIRLRGWLYRPAREGAWPAIAMAPGFNCVKEQVAEHGFPNAFAAAGYAVLLYDNPNCGCSEGEPRNEIDPIAEARAYRDAITYLIARPEVDGDRIAIWGTSYSGGHVLSVAAADRRIRCVVSQVPTVSGHGALVRRYSPDGIGELRRAWAHDRLARMGGSRPRQVRQVGETGPSAEYFASLSKEALATWVNSITVRSSELASEYEPAATIAQISPTPLLMIVADDDRTTFTDLELEAYNRALEPKELLLVSGGHHCVYNTQAKPATAAALDWFARYL